tara:strand:+ start:672 stop:1112 length:441 start_codon:yes stop_codon:yes gene_type:complete
MKKFFSLNFSSSFSKNISRREILGFTSVIMFLGIPKISVASNVQLEKKNFAHNYALYKGIPIIFLKELSVLLKNGGSLLINGKKDPIDSSLMENLVLSNMNVSGRQIIFDKLDLMVERDYQYSRVVLLNGWMLSDTEAQIFSLYCD